MFFNSYIFVFLFLPVTIIGYYLLRSIKGINNSFLVLYLLIKYTTFIFTHRKYRHQLYSVQAVAASVSG